MIPINNNFNEWKEAYYIYLEDIFYIFKNKLKDELPLNKKAWDSPLLFNKFCKLLYLNSSKYITPYL